MHKALNQAIEVLKTGEQVVWDWENEPIPSPDDLAKLSIKELDLLYDLRFYLFGMPEDKDPLRFNHIKSKGKDQRVELIAKEFEGMYEKMLKLALRSSLENFSERQKRVRLEHGRNGSYPNTSLIRMGIAQDPIFSSQHVCYLQRFDSGTETTEWFEVSREGDLKQIDPKDLMSPLNWVNLWGSGQVIRNHYSFQYNFTEETYYLTLKLVLGDNPLDRIDYVGTKINYDRLEIGENSTLVPCSKIEVVPSNYSFQKPVDLEKFSQFLSTVSLAIEDIEGFLIDPIAFLDEHYASKISEI